MKDEGSNLGTMIIVQKLGLEKYFQGNCFGHTFSKACKYATTNEKVNKSFKYVSIYKCITQPKKFGKGRQEWNKTCVDFGLRPRKFNTL